jgi:hypothetical protein
MAITVVSLTNAAAESGSTTGWTEDQTISFTFAVTTTAPYAGTYSFTIGRNKGFGQTYTLSGPEQILADAGTMIIRGRAASKQGSASSGSFLYLKFYDASDVIIHEATLFNNTTAWTLLERYVLAPIGTRKIRIGSYTYNGTDPNAASFWDAFEIAYSSTPADFPTATRLDNTQYGTYALAARPAVSAIVNQTGAIAVGQTETVSGFHDLMFHQAGAYALVRKGAERQDLTAWTFKQDDHEFYVLQLNSLDTLVFDKLTGQWTDWISPDYNHWRGADGCNWEGIAVCGDTRSGKLWQIDPEGRLDYGTTPIVSIIVGGFTERMRTFKPIYMAELAVSEGQPPAVVEGTVGISLRTGDAQGNWVSHGEVIGEDIGENITVRWYGLGLAAPSGAVFEITDTGYARRIDGLNIEIGE